MGLYAAIEGVYVEVSFVKIGFMSPLDLHSDKIYACIEGGKDIL